VALVEVNKVSKRFLLGSTAVDALREVSCQLEAASMVALVGPSGSGKSTLLNLIGAIDRPSSGSITVDGQELGSLSAYEQADFRNRCVGFVFQSFNLIPVLTSIENVMLPAQLSGSFDPTAARTRAEGLMAAVGLADQVDQPVNRLSGGQMQRVAIARALMNSPKLVLADEPTANLDQVTARGVLDLLRHLCVSEGCLVAVATHDPLVIEFCDRVLPIRDGRIGSDAST